MKGSILQDGVSVSEEVSVISLDGHRFQGTKHEHRQAQLLYAVSGVISITTDMGSWVVPPSRAVWIPPGMPHETSSPAGIQFRSLLIEKHAIHGLPEECMVVDITPLLRELILKLTDLAGKSTNLERTDAVVRLLMMELSFQSPQPLNLPAPKHPDLARFCQQVRVNLAEALSIEEASAMLHMSRASFIRFFKQETGMSFGQWRQQARMLAALVLLAEGRSVLGVALECGYNSPSAFSAIFRRSLGKSPSDYFESKTKTR